MDLRLDRYPHTEPFKPNLVRLLFEGSVPTETEEVGGRDFYLYAWVRDGKSLESFQAVLDDSITMVFRAPGYVTMGRVGRTPMNRAISASDSADDRRKMLLAVKELRNDGFPSLLKNVETIVVGQKATLCDLTEQEGKELAGLVGGKRG